MKRIELQKAYRIPERPHSQLEIKLTVQLVTPVAAVEERAKYRYNKEIKQGNPHHTPREGIKRKAESCIATSNKKSKRINITRKNRVSKIEKRGFWSNEKI